MLHRVETYISQHRLLSSGDKVLVGLSGGADSVALLYILRSLGYSCEAAHCNFHLRGEESIRDENFVSSLCANWEIPIHKTSFATLEYAKNHSISIEMAARELRYEWFEQLRQSRGCRAIAVAHHQNDQAETLLLNLSRGSGLKGLCGMRPKNGYIIRPLLCVRREEIETFCKENELSYVVDSSNSDTSFRRNAYRQLLQSASASDIRHFAETAERMQTYQQLLESLLLGSPIEGNAQLTLLYELLQPYGFNASQIADVLKSLSSSGKRFEASDYIATIDHGQLTIQSRLAKEDTPPTLLRAIRPRMPKEHFAKAEEDWTLIDADKLHGELTLRHWQAGDWFYPLTNGKRIKKKLQDFFTDIKLSVSEKERVWLVCSGEDIVWIVGYRLDDRYKITDATRRIAELQIEQEQ